MIASGMSTLFLLSMRCNVYISDYCCGTPIIVVAMYHDSLAFGRIYTVERRLYVGFQCMSTSLRYVLKNNPPS